MLDMVDFPLTNTQISDFFLEQDYTDYFHVQRVLNDLIDAGLIRAESTHNNTQYTVTDAGRETLSFFRDKISDAIERDTVAFLEKNKLQLKNDSAVLASYDKAPGEGYAVRCRYRERAKNLIDLTLLVKTKAQAEAVCDNWNRQNADVYAYLMDHLIK